MFNVNEAVLIFVAAPLALYLIVLALTTVRELGAPQEAQETELAPQLDAVMTAAHEPEAPVAQIKPTTVAAPSETHAEPVVVIPPQAAYEETSALPEPSPAPVIATAAASELSQEAPVEPPSTASAEAESLTAAPAEAADTETWTVAPAPAAETEQPALSTPIEEQVPHAEPQPTTAAETEQPALSTAIEEQVAHAQASPAAEIPSPAAETDAALHEPPDAETTAAEPVPELSEAETTAAEATPKPPDAETTAAEPAPDSESEESILSGEPLQFPTTGSPKFIFDYRGRLWVEKKHRGFFRQLRRPQLPPDEPGR